MEIGDCVASVPTAGVPGVPLVPGDPRLIDYIVTELKSQGIFDQFRKECISDIDTKPAYQNLRQRVEVTVDGFLSRQKWNPDLNKNQLREKLRKHILDSNFLDQGVERIVDQVLNPKISSVFLPQVEEVVYKCLGLEKPEKPYNIVKSEESDDSSTPLNVDGEPLLPNDLEAVSPDSVKSHEKSADIILKSKNNDIKMKLVESKVETEIKLEKSVPSVETYDSDESKDDDFESPAFEPIDDLKQESPGVSQHSANSDVNSRDSSDWRTSAVESKSVVKSVHSQESNDSTYDKSYHKTTISYDSGEDANITSPLKMNVEQNQASFKFTNEDNSSDARQCFESIARSKKEEKMDCDDGGHQEESAKISSNNELDDTVKHHRPSVESKTSSESNKPMLGIDVSMDSNDSKGSSVFTNSQKDSFIVKDSYTFTNKIASLSDKSFDDTSNSNELKIDLQESSEDNAGNISRLSITGSEDLKSPGGDPTKDDASKRTAKDIDRHKSSSHHSRDRKDDSRHHSKSSHSKHSSHHDDRRHSSSSDRRDSSHRSHKESISSDRDRRRDKYHKSSNGDRDKESRDRHGSSSHRSSSSSYKHSSHKSSSSSRHDDRHKHSTSDRSDRPSLSRHESKDSHRSDRNKDLPRSSRESSKDKSSSRGVEKGSDYPSHDKNRHSHSDYKDKSKHSSSSSDRHKKTEDKKQDDKKSKERSDGGEPCSSKTGRTRRSTDRDSNDGNEGSSRHFTSNSRTSTHQTSAKEKSSHQSKSSHSNGNSSSGQSDSASDKVKVSAGGYIKSEFNMFQPVVKKSPPQLPLHRSPDGTPPGTSVPTKKPVIHLDDQLKPSKDEAQPTKEESSPIIQHIGKLKKPKIASNIYEARKLMKVRKNLDLLERKQLQEAQKELEKTRNISKGESKVYSDTCGPELQIICRKRSISNPKSPKGGYSPDTSGKDVLLYFDEESKTKAVSAFEKSKKHLKHLLATHNGISQKMESTIFLVNASKTVEAAFTRQSFKNHVIKTVNIAKSNVGKLKTLNVDIPVSSETSLPSSSQCFVELDDLKYNHAYSDLIQSKCLPLKKRKMSEGKIIRSIDIKPDTLIEIKPNVVKERSMSHDDGEPSSGYSRYSDDNEQDYEYLDYYSKVDDVLSKTSQQDIMEIIFGAGVSFDSALVDLNHMRQPDSSSSSNVPAKSPTSGAPSSNGKTLQNKKRRISFKDADEIIEPGKTYRNSIQNKNDCSLAKRRNISSDNKNGDCGDTNENHYNNNIAPIKSVLSNKTWSNACTVGPTRDAKPLKGIIRNKLQPTQDTPQSPDSDRSVENHPNSVNEDSFNSKQSKDCKENSDEISSSALNQIKFQTRSRPLIGKSIVKKCASEMVFDKNIVSTEKV